MFDLEPICQAVLERLRTSILGRVVGLAVELASMFREAMSLPVATPQVLGPVASLRRGRSVRIIRTALTSGLSTVLTMLTGIISVSLTVRYLGTERYGLWLTISTILAWLNLTDAGIGNALTNRIAKAYGQDKLPEAQHYVASAFWLFTVVGVTIAVGGAVLGVRLRWADILRVQSVDAARELPSAISLALVIYGLGFPLSMARSVYNGFQEGYYANYWSIAASVLSLVALVVVTRFGGGLPLLVGAVFGVRQLVAAVSSLFLFTVHRPQLRPVLSRARLNDLGSLLSVGLMFVVLQLTSLLITQSDNLVIVRLLGPEQVALFGTAWKLFSYVGVLQLWLLAPMWPAYGEAFARGDTHWVRQTLRFSLLSQILMTLVVVAGGVIFGSDIIGVWAGKDLVPPLALLVGMGLIQILWAWTQPFVFVLNGIGRLKGQTVYGLMTALLCLVLKIVFVAHYGILGAVASTLIAYALLAAWLLPLDTIIALNRAESDKKPRPLDCVVIEGATWPREETENA